MKIFKNQILFIITIILTLFLSACTQDGSNSSQVNYNLDVVTLTENFYKTYLAAYDKNESEEDLLKIKEMYMTEVLAEELTLRSFDMEADAITGVQDATGFIKYLDVKEGADDMSAVATFTVPVDGDEVAKNTYIFDIHFRLVDNKKLMDTYDLNWIETDSDGYESRVEYKTWYANKEELTEADKIAMKNKREYYEELFEEGYVG